MGIHTTIPILLLAFIAIALSQTTPLPTVLDCTAGTQPYMSVANLACSNNQLSVRASVKLSTNTGGYQTLVHSYNAGDVPTSQFAVSFVNGYVAVRFGSSTYTSIRASYPTNDQWFSIVVDVSENPVGTVTITVYINNVQVGVVTVGGHINYNNVRSNTFVGIEQSSTGSFENALQGEVDNFLIVTSLSTVNARLAFNNPSHFAPTTDDVNLCAFAAFDDSLSALGNTAIVTTSYNGNQYQVGQLTNEATLKPFVQSDAYYTCSANGDPHFYDWYGNSVGDAGEHVCGSNLFTSCDEQGNGFEVRFYASYTYWWANTVFRAVAVKYQDYVWRCNIDETDQGTNRALYGCNAGILGLPAGNYMKHITDTAWTPLSQNGAGVYHAPTGVYYVSAQSPALTVVVDGIGTVAIQGYSNMYMGVQITLNLGLCTIRRGACEYFTIGTYMMGYGADIWFQDWLPTPLQPSTKPNSSPCDNVPAAMVNQINAACLSYYPSKGTVYNDCVFDACSSGDVNIIPLMNPDPECILEKLINGTSATCTITKCTASCYGRGTCNEATGNCACTAGWVGLDCYQPSTFPCFSASYGNLNFNVLPRATLSITGLTLQSVITKYGVSQSLLIYPTTFNGNSYLIFSFSNPKSTLAGSATVCLTTTIPVTFTQSGLTSYAPQTPTGSQYCFNAGFNAQTSGGFAALLGATGTVSVAVSNLVGVSQVLIGSANTIDGFDVTRIGSQYFNAITFSAASCDSTPCAAHDGNCVACNTVSGCGYCLESSRCQLGDPTGPTYGLCSNWRYGLNQAISRVVTVSYTGADLVDPDYEIFLGGANSLYTSLFVKTGKASSQYDILFMFETSGTYSDNAGVLKTNLLNSLTALSANNINLAVGFYGSTAGSLALSLTAIAPSNYYIFGRAMESSQNLGTSGGGQANAVTIASGSNPNPGFRSTSTRIGIFMVYDHPADYSSFTPAIRAAATNPGFVPVWLIAGNYADNLQWYNTFVANSVNGLPGLVFSVDAQGASFPSVFSEILLYATSFPSVVFQNLADPTYVHVDTASLTAEGEALSIFGLIDSSFRAKFLIPMFKGTSTSNQIAVINVPGFGVASIEDIASEVPTAVTKDIVLGENEVPPEFAWPCQPVQLSGAIFQNLFNPIYQITSLPPAAEAILYNFAADGVSPGSALNVGDYSVADTICFTLPPGNHGLSLTNDWLYTSFTYITTDTCENSATATINVHIAPKYIQPQFPYANTSTLTIYENQQVLGVPINIPMLAFDADRTPGSDYTIHYPLTYSYEPLSQVVDQWAMDTFSNEVLWVNSSAQVAYGTKYGPYYPDSTTSLVQYNILYYPTDIYFFGQLVYRVTVNDELYEVYSQVIVNVLPWNNLPQYTGPAYFISQEDQAVKITLLGFDRDSTGITMDVNILTLKSGNVTYGGNILTTGVNHGSLCQADANSRSIECDLVLTPSFLDYSCTESNYSLVVQNCPTPFATIQVTLDDHNAVVAGPQPGITTFTVDVHIIFFQYPPLPPADVVITALENTGTNYVPAQQTFEVLAYNTLPAALSLKVDTFPQFATLFQADEVTQITTAAPWIFDSTGKRIYSQNMTATVMTPLHVYGRLNAQGNWYYDTFTYLGYNNNTYSISPGKATVNVIPINDPPYGLSTVFKMKENNGQNPYNAFDISASDIDTHPGNLTYTILTIPQVTSTALDFACFGVLVYGNIGGNFIQLAGSGPWVMDDPSITIRPCDHWWSNLPSDPNSFVSGFSYSVTDKDENLTPASPYYKVNTVTSNVKIVVVAVNDAPNMNGVSPVTNEDVALIINLTGADWTYGEHDPTTAIIVTTVTDGTLYQYDDALWPAVQSDFTQVTGLVAVTDGTTVTDSLGRVIYVPNLWKSDALAPSFLYSTPSFTAKITETSNACNTPNLVSATQSVAITINFVNNDPVAWDDAWKNSPYNSYYGVDSTSPNGWPQNSALCYDNCTFLEDLGILGPKPQPNAAQIYFGGRDVELSVLTILINSITCAPNAVMQYTTSTGTVVNIDHSVALATPLTLPQTVASNNLQAGLLFTPGLDEYSLPNPNENHPNGQTLLRQASPYCAIVYTLQDVNGGLSNPKTITIDVIQINDDPRENLTTTSDKNAPADSSTIQLQLYGYENLPLVFKLDSYDVEGDDFQVYITGCGSKGLFYLPADNQAQYIDQFGVLDQTYVNVSFQTTPVDCSTLTPSTPYIIPTSFTNTGNKGWYMQFTGNANEYGPNYNELDLSYRDSIIPSRPATGSSRTINLQSVNQAPTIAVRGKALSGDTPITVVNWATYSGPIGVNGTLDLVVPVSTSVALQLAFNDVDAFGASLDFSVTMVSNSTGTFTAMAPGSGKDQMYAWIGAGSALVPNADGSGFTFSGSIASANQNFFPLAVSFNQSADFIIYIVVNDLGHTGLCPPNQVALPDGTCPRVSSATVLLSSSSSSSIVTIAATASGAAFLALLAVGAVALAKLLKPADADGWQEFEGFGGDNSMTSGIYQGGTTGGQSGIYQGNQN